MKKILKEMWENISMHIRYLIFFFLGMMTVGMPCLISCSMMQAYPEDNIIEEAIEEVIEDLTGIEVDLSPYSLECEAEEDYLF